MEKTPDRTLVVALTVAALLKIANAEDTIKGKQREQGINMANLQNFAALPPHDLSQALRYLENPFVAAALVEGGKTGNQHSGSGTAPRAFSEGEPASDLPNYLLRRMYEAQGPPQSVDAVLKHPILGSYFGDSESFADGEPTNINRNFEEKKAI